MNNTESLRPSDLALASYGSPLRKPVIRWGIAAALLILIIYSLTQLMPFFRFSNPQYIRVIFTAMAITGAIIVIPVLVLRWLDRREPEPWLFYVICFAWGGLIATTIAGVINHSIDKVLGDYWGGSWQRHSSKRPPRVGLLVLVLLLRDEFDGPRWLHLRRVDRPGVHLAGVVGFHRTELRGERNGRLGIPDWVSLRPGRSQRPCHVHGHLRHVPRLRPDPEEPAPQDCLAHPWLPAGRRIAHGLEFAGDRGFCCDDHRNRHADDAARCPGSFPERFDEHTVLAELAVERGRALGGQRPHATDHLFRPAPQRRWERSVMVEQLRDEVGTPSVTPDDTRRSKAGVSRRARTRPRVRSSWRSATWPSANSGVWAALTRPVDDDPVVQAWRQELRHLRQPTPA